MAVLIGSSSAGADAANSNLGGVAFATRLQCATSGTIDSLFVKSAQGVGTRTFHAAVYADSAGPVPGARLTADILGPPTAVSGWHQYTVSPGLAVTSGTFYWLAFLAVGGTYSYTDNATSGGTSKDGPASQTALNNPFGTPSGSFTNRFNAYGDGTAGGGAATVKQLAALGVG